MTQEQRSRKVSALARLEKQLQSGVKTTKGTMNEKTPLSEKDIKRIKGEIVKLSKKIKNV